MKGLFVLLALIAAVAANLCPQEKGVEKLLPHEDCKKFYKCTYGKPVEQDCPAHLYFNLELELCDWPANVDCGNRNVEGDNVVQEQGDEEVSGEPEPEDEVEDCAPEEDNAETEEEIALHKNGCPVDPSVHKLLPHEEICNLFYYCVDGEKVLKQCAYSLHFNSEIQVCDWPSNAGCAVSANKHLSGRREIHLRTNF